MKSRSKSQMPSSEASPHLLDLAEHLLCAITGSGPGQLPAQSWARIAQGRFSTPQGAEGGAPEQRAGARAMACDRAAAGTGWPPGRGLMVLERQSRSVPTRGLTEKAAEQGRPTPCPAP